MSSREVAIVLCRRDVSEGLRIATYVWRLTLCLDRPLRSAANVPGITSESVVSTRSLSGTYMRRLSRIVFQLCQQVSNGSLELRRECRIGGLGIGHRYKRRCGNRWAEADTNSSQPNPVGNPRPHPMGAGDGNRDHRSVQLTSQDCGPSLELL